MVNQIIQMYVDATGDKIDISDFLKYKAKVKSWALKNKDKIVDAYGTTLLPGHAFMGYKTTDGSEEQWHFSSNGSVEGKDKGKVYKKNSSTVTHFRNFKACPKTLKLIAEFLKKAQQNPPYYHWNAGELKTQNGKKLSNCIIFALEAVSAGGINVSDLGSPIEPWDLGPHSTFTKK